MRGAKSLGSLQATRRGGCGVTLSQAHHLADKRHFTFYTNFRVCPGPPVSLMQRKYCLGLLFGEGKVRQNETHRPLLAESWLSSALFHGEAGEGARHYAKLDEASWGNDK